MNGREDWLLVVDVTVEPDVEDDWNRWYDTQHLPAVAACPGFTSAQRYVSEHGGGRRYQTIYAIDSPAALETPEFTAARGWYQFAPYVQASVRTYRRLAGGTSS